MVRVMARWRHQVWGRACMRQVWGSACMHQVGVARAARAQAGLEGGVDLALVGVLRHPQPALPLRQEPDAAADVDEHARALAAPKPAAVAAL